MKVRNIIMLGIVFLGMCLIILWLSGNNFFLYVTESDFSNLLMPIIGLFTIILLIWTLSESIKFNKRQLSINEYNILLSDFERIKERLENLKFELNIKLYVDKNALIRDIEKSNGIKYCNLLFQFLNFEMSELKEGDPKISSFRNSVLYPINRIYRELEVFLNEVLCNDILNKSYQIKLYKKVEQLLLQEYFRVCNNRDENGNFIYDLEVFNVEGVFNGDDFKRINNLFKDNNLFNLYPEKGEFYIKNT